MAIDGAAFAIIGALDAFPRRLAAREIEARGGALRRGISRGRISPSSAIGWSSARSAASDRARASSEARRAGAPPISESAFLRCSVCAEAPTAPRDLSARQLIEQSGLDAETFDLLRLFDVFESAEEPFGFRDLVAARQYARLSREGSTGSGWCARARGGRAPRAASPMCGWSAPAERRADAERRGAHGAVRPAPPGAAGEDADRPTRLFEEAQEAEEEEDWARAAALYRRCAAIEPPTR